MIGFDFSVDTHPRKQLLETGPYKFKEEVQTAELHDPVTSPFLGFLQAFQPVFDVFC